MVEDTQLQSTIPGDSRKIDLVSEDPKSQSLQERIKNFEREFALLQEKYQIRMEPALDFPLYRKLPPIVQLALEVIKKESGTIVTSYVDLQKGDSNADVS